jgi:alcohol dehydrogenase
VTIDGSGSQAGLRLALRSTDHDGICINVAMPFRDTALPLFDMYMDGVTLVMGRNNARRHMPAVIDLIADARIDPTLVSDRVVGWNDAEDALADPPDKLVILGPNG